jgi:hypothetical protein
MANRISATEVRSFSQVHQFLKPGELLEDNCQIGFYRDMWRLASSQHFEFNVPDDADLIKRMEESKAYSPLVQ